MCQLAEHLLEPGLQIGLQNTSSVKSLPQALISSMLAEILLRGFHSHTDATDVRHAMMVAHAHISQK